jgi:hypothetical protein
MKNLYAIIALLFFSSCEDVIEVELNEGPRRLVIDANIIKKKESDGKEQRIRLTKTVGFYESQISPANGAEVMISDGTTEFLFEENEMTGIYATETFEPEIDKTYTLSVIFNGETYNATETLKPVTDITKIEQSEENFFGTVATRVDFFYTDPEEEENYYLSEFVSPEAFLLNQYRVRRDEFTNGNESSIFEIDENLSKGDELTLRFYGISESYHNYLDLLFEQVQNGGPFATAPAAVNGNCTNTTQPENKPYGYFRLSEMVEETYIIK